MLLRAHSRTVPISNPTKLLANQKSVVETTTREFFVTKNNNILCPVC